MLSLIYDQARFSGTRFMTVVEYNEISSTDRHRAPKGQCYVRHEGKWRKVGFRKPVKVALAA